MALIQPGIAIPHRANVHARLQRLCTTPGGYRTAKDTCLLQLKLGMRTRDRTCHGQEFKGHASTPAMGRSAKDTCLYLPQASDYHDTSRGVRVVHCCEGN